MKALYSLIIALAIVGCQKSEHAHQHDDEAIEPDSTNTILYNQVMDIHDEVMPKMEDLYNLKKDPQSCNWRQLRMPTKSKSSNNALQRSIAASQLMMDWMHDFNPPADSADSEQKEPISKEKWKR